MKTSVIKRKDEGCVQRIYDDDYREEDEEKEEEENNPSHSSPPRLIPE